MSDVLDELDAVLDRLAEAGRSDSDAVVRLHGQLARLDALTTQAVGRWNTDLAWAADGARSGASWLAYRCRVPLPAVRRRVRLARACTELPHVEAAWLAGDVDVAHVSALAGARNERTAEVMVRDEVMLVDEARRLRFDHFHRVLAYWSQHADPDGVETDAERLRQDRRWDLSRTFAGAWVGDHTLDPIGGAIVSNAMLRIERELFDTDRAEAKTRLGRDPLPGELARTPAQRRADALVEMAARAMTAPADGRRPEPLFSVLVDYETFAGRVCELADGTVITPGTLTDWLEEAWIERIVFDGPSRVLDVGVERRLFTGATRRAVEIRDRECFDPTCDVPADHAQIDHIFPWAVGGPTVQANGRPACGYHNRLRHRQPRAG